MIGRAYAAGVFGIDGFVTRVEAAIGPGLPSLTIVGQGADGPLLRSALRVRIALDRCGFQLPALKQLVNLAPAERRKDGSGMDLAIACALLVCHGVIPAASLADVLLWGELGPDGRLLPAVGTLIAAETARRHGFCGVVLASACVREAAPIGGLDLLPVSDLPQLIAHLRGELVIAPALVTNHETASDESAPGLTNVHDPRARLALEVMVAGGHHLLAHGPHGSGKTTLARAVAGLLGELGDDEALELTKIHSARSPAGWLRTPQVRMPASSMDLEDLLGGGAPPQPGEVSLAHNGVLALDDLPAFSAACLDGVRRAIEDGAVRVGDARFPARFRLLATMQRCPCGWLGHPERACTDKLAAIRRFQARLPSSLLDRIDLVIPLGAPAPTNVADWSADAARGRVATARSRQRARLAQTTWRSNAEIPASGPVLEQLCPLTPAAEDLLTEVARRDDLDLRGVRRLHRVARTVADLDPTRDPCEAIDVEAMALALTLRSPLDGHYPGS